jgi:hypothetical protein
MGAGSGRLSCAWSHWPPVESNLISGMAAHGNDWLKLAQRSVFFKSTSARRISAHSHLFASLQE